MKYKKVKLNLKGVLTVTALFLLGLCAISFAVLYVERSEISLIKNNRFLVETTVVIIVCLLTIISYLFSQNDDSFAPKITLTFLVLISVLTLGLYAVKVSGLENKIDSVSSLRRYILSYGQFVIPVFMLLQFLQVVILPIPSVVLLGAGIALFGAIWGAVLSYISIVLASLVAFFIGRKFGVKTVGWLIGEKNLKRGLNLIKGKDKIFITFMLIFPFFPDDLLCFTSGLSTVSYKYFAIIVSISRFISVCFTTLILCGKLLPFNTLWGAIIWLIFFALTVIICIYIYKNGENIERGFIKVFKRKNGKDYSSRRFE
ncbi:MAG: TVP38/TMEM64 family protein [Clostridia bacterium]|nr:TVP38/TMEM64 family protein [Clostridia bacterium]